MISIKAVARIFKGGAGWSEKTCFICGEHFKSTDGIAVVVVHDTNWDIAKQYKRLNQNQIMHVNELEQICNISNSIDDVYRILNKAPKPAKKKMTNADNEKVIAFIRAAYACGFRDGKETADGCTCKKFGSTDTIKYNVFSDRMRYSNKRKRQMFDSIAERQILANVYNKFHELLGDGKYDDYSATKALCDITDTVNKNMKGLGF